MKTYNTSNVRNVVLLGASKSGKTSLAETMMFEGRIIDRRGSVEAKNTMSDNSEVEQINQRSIFSTLLYTEFMDTKLNIIDTPGSDDFVGGVFAAFSVAETGILLVNATQGVEVGTEIFARHAFHHNKPLIIAVNQLDNEKQDWNATMESLNKAFGKKIVAVQFPVNPGTGFDTFVDILKMKKYRYTDENGTREETAIPSDLESRSMDLHQELVEMAAENEEKLMEAFFDKGVLSEDEIREGLKMGMMKGDIIPVFCISAQKDIGVKRLMEFTINTTPSPDIVKAELKDGSSVDIDVNGPASLYVYKTSQEQHLGDVSYFKVMSGKAVEGMDVINPETGDKERIGAIYAVAGRNKTKVQEICAGDIGCTVKLKGVKCCQTLDEPDCDWIFKPTRFPDPKFRIAIRARDSKDDEKLGELLNKASAEDPTIHVLYSKELRQTILSGQGELQINILKWQLNNISKLEVELYPPKIPYRETITKVARADYRHKKQSGGAGQFGEVHLLIEPYVEGAPEKTKFRADGMDLSMNIKGREEYPLEWGGKLVFYNCIVGGSIDARFMPAILKGIMEKMTQGPLTGSYARDIKVYVYDGKMHPVDSNELAFKLAARNAFREAFRKAAPKIMEPIYNVQIMVPSDCMGDVMSDLQNRRAMIEGMNSEKGFEILNARVPLAELYKYSTSLSSLTSGRATFTMKFADYQQVPSNVQEVLLKNYQEEEKEE
ncbi:MAG: elongation factor G [Bacteroidales bacterium]|jgi:elongation factor G|nr:elongation factor G [Bacteroidales bacterium]